jgi:hypothetical protein
MRCRSNPAQYGYLSSWTIAYTLYLIGQYGMSLVAEAAPTQSALMYHCPSRLSSVVSSAQLSSVAPLMRLFGGDCKRGAFATVVPPLPNAVLRLRCGASASHAIVVIVYALCGLVLGLSFVLMPTSEIEGLGWAWLIGETIMAGILLLTKLRTMWLLRLMDTAKLTVILRLPRQLMQRWSDRHQKSSAVRLFPHAPTHPLSAKLGGSDLGSGLMIAVVVWGRCSRGCRTQAATQAVRDQPANAKEVLTELFANPQLKFSPLLPAVLAEKSPDSPPRSSTTRRGRAGCCSTIRSSRAVSNCRQQAPITVAANGGLDEPSCGNGLTIRLVIRCVLLAPSALARVSIGCGSDPPNQTL